MKGVSAAVGRWPSADALGRVIKARWGEGLVGAGSITGAIFRVARYRFATAGQVTSGFDSAALEHAFAPKKRR